jgi:Ca2+-binding EF-hand superfamily protein
MKCATCAAAALLSCLISAPAVAHGEQERREPSNAAQTSERRQARFRGMDTNRDGVITRQEWRGNDQSFARRDSNRDGVLSGSEVWEMNDSGWQERGQRDNALLQSFRRADANRDGIISRSEWASDANSFSRVDVNNDGVVTEPEFLGEGWEEWGAGVDRESARAERFRQLDANRDGVLARGEWTGAAATFNRRDANRDGVLSQSEFAGAPRDEWDDSSATRRDSPAFQRGYDRGLADGRQAGREDRELRNQWDLEGQRELEQADAGYNANLGSREDYQTGYRAGFRAGYRQGFGPR